MKTIVLLFALSALFIAGCGNKEAEALKQQLSQSESDKAALQQNINERDKYFEDVMRAVNDVNAINERARTSQSQITEKQGSEGTAQFASVESRQKLLQNLEDISNSIKANRKRIGFLQAGAAKYRNQIAGLDSLIRSLNSTLEQREQAIAQLTGQVQGLQTTVAEKTRAIAEKDSTIDVQQKNINTAFYVVGTRDELRKKGIIRDEGGFLWGLLGSTTVMAPTADRADFTPIDKTRDQTIHVDGKVEEILPHRMDDSYAMAQQTENGADLTITTPDKFWRDRYLIIVKD